MRRRDTAQHQLLSGELAVAKEDVQMMCLQLLLHASHFMLEFWIVLDGFELSGIELDWIGF